MSLTLTKQLQFLKHIENMLKEHTRVKVTPRTITFFLEENKDSKEFHYQVIRILVNARMFNINVMIYGS